MAHRTFNPAQRPASKRSTHVTGTGIAETIPHQAPDN